VAHPASPKALDFALRALNFKPTKTSPVIYVDGFFRVFVTLRGLRLFDMKDGQWRNIELDELAERLRYRDQTSGL
jgi:hypothetical protein